MKTFLAILVAATLSVDLFAAAFNPVLPSATVASGGYEKLPTFTSGTTLPNVVNSNGVSAVCTNLAWNVQPGQDCGLWLQLTSTNYLTNGTFVLHMNRSPDLAGTPASIKILPQLPGFVVSFTIATNTPALSAWYFANLGSSNYSSSRSVQVSAVSNVTAIAITGSKLVVGRAY